MQHLHISLDYGPFMTSSEVDPAEIRDYLDWWCYTKPVGPSVRVITTSESSARVFSVVAAGTQPGVAEKEEPFPGSGVPVR